MEVKRCRAISHYGSGLEGYALYGGSGAGRGGGSGGGPAEAAAVRPSLSRLLF